MSLKIEPMKKVTVMFTAGTKSGADNLASQEVVQFIHGTAPDGLSQFEVDLAGKYSGDELAKRIELGHQHGYLGRLTPYFKQKLGVLFGGQAVYLSFLIVDVETPGNREIVQAIASGSAGCGGGCDCGCS